MRPVSKGSAPSTYNNYRDAKPDLVDRIGEYCCYCERQIETHLAVEHVIPQTQCPSSATKWRNFVLSCVNCNSCKLDTPVKLSDHLWPHRDNTLRAFEYRVGGIVSAHGSLNTALSAKANATIRLVGLDKRPGLVGREPTSADKRWLKRQQTWSLAQRKRQDLQAQDTTALREAIVDIAVSRGIFSIWWTVFNGDADMRCRLRRAFVGTHHQSFDAQENAVQRARGQV
ncbi:MAG: hypothetical protein SangKO_040600 [Sandaracinaceae bacterium]